MLYWICPECGHECSPAIRECPTCTASPESTARNSTVQQRSSPSKELLSLAQNFESSSSVGLLAPAATVAVAEPVEPPPPKEPERSETMASLDGLAVNPVRPQGSEPAKPIPAPVPARISSPAAPLWEHCRAEFELKAAGPEPAGEIVFRAAPGGRRRSFEQTAVPLASRRQSVAFVRVELPGADHSGMGFTNLAELVGQPGHVRLNPAVPYQNGQHQNGQSSNGASTPLTYQPGVPSLGCSRLKLDDESVADLLNGLKIGAEEQDRDTIHAIQESFCEQPAVALLAAPAEILMAPAPPAAKWLRMEKPKFTPVAPELTGRAAVIAGPQAPPLAGPSLPPQLINFGQRNSKLKGNRRRMSAWPISLLIATVVLLGAGGLLQYTMQDHDAKAVTVTTPAPRIKAAPAARVRVVEEHPAARSVEVAGVRIVTGANKKPQLQYLVINHSPSEITGLNIHIAVRSVEALGDAPLCSVSSIVASLGPNQSKEVHTDLDSSVATSAIPDWHSLRTEILIARQ
jgi:hypothetical protein